MEIEFDISGFKSQYLNLFPGLGAVTLPLRASISSLVECGSYSLTVHTVDSNVFGMPSAVIGLLIASQ